MNITFDDFFVILKPRISYSYNRQNQLQTPRINDHRRKSSRLVVVLFETHPVLVLVRCLSLVSAAFELNQLSNHCL